MVKYKLQEHNQPKTKQVVTSEPSSPSTASPRYPNTPEEKDPDLKSHHMKMVETLKRYINISHKQMQGKTDKQVEAFKKKTNKYLNVKQENKTR